MSRHRGAVGDLAFRRRLQVRHGRPAVEIRDDEAAEQTRVDAEHARGRAGADHPRWSAYWDKKHGLWRVAEDDPDSDLYAESSDADTVIAYITAHS